MSRQPRWGVHRGNPSQRFGFSLRAHFTPFSLPPIEEVVAALHNTFPNEPGMIVQPLRGRGQGLFKVTLTSPIEDVRTHTECICQELLPGGDLMASMSLALTLGLPIHCCPHTHTHTFTNAHTYTHRLQSVIYNSDYDARAACLHTHLGIYIYEG